MTEQEELNYLCDLLLQSSRWERSEGEVLTGLELEVQDRVRRLTGRNTVDENGLAQSEPLEADDGNSVDDEQTAAYLETKSGPDKAKAKWKIGRVRCKENGKIVWRLQSECKRVPCFPNNPTAKKFKWVWQGPSND